MTCPPTEWPQLAENKIVFFLMLNRWLGIHRTSMCNKMFTAYFSQFSSIMKRKPLHSSAKNYSLIWLKREKNVYVWHSLLWCKLDIKWYTYHTRQSAVHVHLLACLYCLMYCVFTVSMMMLGILQLRLTSLKYCITFHHIYLTVQFKLFNSILFLENDKYLKDLNKNK